MMKKSIFLAIVISFLALLTLIFYLFEMDFENLKEEDFKHKIEKVHAAFNQRVEQRRKDLDYYLQKILEQKELLEALKYGQREKIDLIVKPYYDTLSRVDTSIKILTFRTKEGITLYRAHRREFFGDTLNKKRVIILDTDEQKRSLSGFEVGKLSITYRVTHPIFHENEYIGNVEIGVDPTVMLQNLSTVLDVDIGVAAQNRFLEVMQGRDTLYIGDKLFMLQGNRNLEDYFSIQTLSQNGYRVDTSVDLKNHKAEPIGYMILGLDVQKQFHEYKEQREKFFCLLMLVLSIFFALFVFLFYRVNKQLKRGNEDSGNYLNLVKVLKEESVVPYFQPIVDAQEKVVKYEALMRIVYKEGAEKKVLLPDVFLKGAIKDELYISLFQSMIRKSLHHFREKKEMISLNFLPDDLFNVYIMQEFVQSIEMFDSSSRVVVEIAEQKCAENFAKLLQVTKKLKELGVAICIDDYDGSMLNYSSILAINPRYIKINETLIQKTGIAGDEKIHSIVRFAKEQNIKIIAEFVENKETFELLKKCSVEEFQGYYFGYPQDLINSQ